MINLLTPITKQHLDMTLDILSNSKDRYEYSSDLAYLRKDITDWLSELSHTVRGADLDSTDESIASDVFDTLFTTWLDGDNPEFKQMAVKLYAYKPKSAPFLHYMALLLAVRKFRDSAMEIGKYYLNAVPGFTMRSEDDCKSYEELVDFNNMRNTIEVMVELGLLEYSDGTCYFKEYPTVDDECTQGIMEYVFTKLYSEFRQMASKKKAKGLAVACLFPFIN